MTQRSSTIQVSGCPQASRSYSCGRWKKRISLQLETKYRGLAEDDEDEEQRDETDTTNKNQQLNKKLLNHFKELAATNQDTDQEESLKQLPNVYEEDRTFSCLFYKSQSLLSGIYAFFCVYAVFRNEAPGETTQVDLQFLDEVISDGADPNSSDRYGQTVLHEISRAWSVDVMRFFLDRGSDLLRPDQFAVTPLHVASALDYQDMVQFLLNRKGLCAQVQERVKEHCDPESVHRLMCTRVIDGFWNGSNGPLDHLSLSQMQNDHKET